MGVELELQNAFADVRGAYRLIWAYQRRCLDTVQFLSSQFNDRVFYYWSSFLTDPVPTRGNTPFNRWALDFLPLYGVSFLFTAQEGFSPEKGQWLLEIRLINDSAYWPLKVNKHEPDLTLFESPEETKSTLALIAWKSLKNSTKEEDWFQNVWNVEDWPDIGSNERTEPKLSLNGKVASFSVERPLEELSSKEKIVSFAVEAKTVFAEKLELKF